MAERGLMDMLQSYQGAGMPFGTDRPQDFAGPGGTYDEQRMLAEVAERARWSNRNTTVPMPGFEPSNFPNYFDAYGSPKLDDSRQVAADAGISLQQLAGGIFPKYNRSGFGQGYQYPSDKGGFFSLDNLFGNLGADVPSLGRFASASPSTNNWRLLGQGPGWIMRNGFLIDPATALWGGQRGWVPNGGITGENPATPSPIGLGTAASLGMPNRYAIGNSPAYAGWPGATNWFQVSGSPG